MRQLLIFLVLLTAGIFFGRSRDNRVVKGIKIYEYDKDFRALALKWKDIGFNSAFVSKELAANSEFRNSMKKAHIKVFVVFPVYYDPGALKRDSGLFAITRRGAVAREDWVEFVCPSRKGHNHAKVAEAAELIRTLKPDGLSIDFIREFVFWEMIYPERTPESIGEACYCDSCIKEFTSRYGIRIPDSCNSVVLKAGFIDNKFKNEWNSYRTDLIATMVRMISDTARSIRPGIKINVHIVPWRDSDFGGANIRVAAQDLEKIAPYADYVSPMCYSQMLRRDADWIASVVSEMDRKAPGKILPSIQVYPYYIDDSFTPEDLGRCVGAALKAPSKGVVFFSWPLFAKDTVREEVVKKEMGLRVSF
jgi:hypothetical protein